MRPFLCLNYSQHVLLVIYFILQIFQGALMKKIKNEKELVKKAITVGMAYAQKRGAAIFSANDSADEKVEYIYRLLVHDKIIVGIPEDQISQVTMRHKLAIWASKFQHFQ